MDDLLLALLAATTGIGPALLFAAMAVILLAAPLAAAGGLGAAAVPLAQAAGALFGFTLCVGAFLRVERRLRLDAARALARYQGDADALAEETEDVDDLKEARSISLKERERRLRELKNALDASVHRTLDLARGALGARTVIYLRYDADRERLAIADAASDDELVEGEIDARSGFFAGAIKSRQSVLLPDVHGSGVAYYRRDPGVRAVAVVPLAQGGWLRGLLVADHVEAGRWTRAHAEILAGMAATIAELEHGGLERERHEKFQDRLKQLVEVSKTLQDSLSPEELAERTLAAARTIAQFDFAMVLTSAGDDRFSVTSAAGVDHGRLAGKDAPTQDTLAGWVLRNRVYLNVSHFRSRTVKTPLLGRRLDPDGVRAALIFPMLHAKTGEPVGAFLFGSLTRDSFTHDEFEMLELIVHQAALAMANAVLYRRMEEMATTDGLTGLHNHRFFQETFLREVERAQRNPATRFALVLTDIDHFKKVNDGYGHPMGDEVLRRVSRVLKTSIQRKTDLVARYGGEEFVLVLADTDADGARGVIDKIRAAIAKETFDAEGKTFRVTMSAGVIAFPDDVGIGSNQKPGDVKQALIDRADKALYHSKETGRNRSTLWREIAPPPLAVANRR